MLVPATAVAAITWRKKLVITLKKGPHGRCRSFCSPPCVIVHLDFFYPLNDIHAFPQAVE